MNIPELLKSFGLTPTEINVYLNALERDGWSAGDLARETNLKRPTVYHALETLEKKGLIHFVGHKRAGKFKAEPPEQLATLIRREQSRLAHLEKKLHQSLPLFPTSDATIGITPEVTYYRGTEGLKNVIEKVYTSKTKELLSIVPSFRAIESGIDEEYMYHYLEEKARHGIVTRSIWQDLPTNKEFLKHKKYLRTVRLAPPSLRGKSTAMVDIFDKNVVTTLPPPELFGVMVTSFNYSELMKAIWKTLWDISKPL